MAKSIPITAATTSFVRPRQNTLVKGLTLAAGADAATLTLYDGELDTVLTFNFPNAGTGYAVGDLVTLVAGENGSADARAVLKVLVVDNVSPSTSISSSPSTSISSSPSTSPSSSVSHSPSNSMSRSTSISSSRSTSPSSSVSTSPSTSISSSPSPSASRSTSISSSPSPSASVSTSISTSPSSSRSTSVSSSPSVSASPSAGSGEITSAEIVFGGGGYTAGNTYATTTNGSGVSATVKVLTVGDPATTTIVAKLGAGIGLSAPGLHSYCGVLCTRGISARTTGTSPIGNLIYE